MSGYKVVPVEPTLDMIEAAQDAYMPFGDMDIALRMALLAAPDVQGEPVAWVTADTVDGQAVNGKPRRIWWENNEGVGMPIYAAPQPSFQLPEFATDPDDSDEVASLWDHGFKRGWNSCLGAVAKAMQPTEQQECGCCGQSVVCDDDCDAVVIGGNKPDLLTVDVLVEALEGIAQLPMDPCSTENDYRLSAAKAIASAAISVHRKQKEST